MVDPLQWWCSNAGSCTFKRATLVHAFVHLSIHCPIRLLFLSSLAHWFGLFDICTFVHSSFQARHVPGSLPKEEKALGPTRRFLLAMMVGQERFKLMDHFGLFSSQ